LKIAAFQVDIGNGAVHLICLPTSSFKAACELESWLTANAKPKYSVTFLGRYERLQTFRTPAEVKGMLVKNPRSDPGGTVVSIEMGVKKLLSHQ